MLVIWVTKRDKKKNFNSILYFAFWHVWHLFPCRSFSRIVQRAHLPRDFTLEKFTYNGYVEVRRSTEPRERRGEVNVWKYCWKYNKGEEKLSKQNKNKNKIMEN